MPDGSPLRMRAVQLGHDEELTCSLNLALSSPRRRRRRTFAGLRGIVGNHFPTYTVRAYRSWPQPRRPAAPAFRPPRPEVAPPRPPPAAGRRPSIQEPANTQQRPRTSKVARPASREPPAQVAASPLAAPPKAATDATSGSSAGRSALTRTGQLALRQNPSGEECNDAASINPPRPTPVDRSEPERTAEGSPERVRLSGTYRSVPLTVVVDPTAWNDCPEMGGPGEAVWVLDRAIQAQSLGPTDRQTVPRRMSIAWIRGEERLPRGKHPTDFNSIAELSKAGWQFEATARLRGGKDRGGPGAEDGPADIVSGSAAGNPLLTSKELLELEAVVRDVTAGRLGENNAPLALAVREVLRLFKASDTAVITPAAPDAPV